MLSRGMRELVASRRLALELEETMNMDLKIVLNVSKSWDENLETQHLVNSKGPLMTSRIRHVE